MNRQIFWSGILPAFVLLSLLMGALSACKPTTGASQAENAVVFDSIEVKEKYHLLGESKNPACELQIKFLYPKEYKDKAIQPLLQKAFITAYFGEEYSELSPREAVDKYVKTYIADYKELEQDFIEEMKNEDSLPIASWFSYYEISFSEILYNQHDLLSFSAFVENYTGGAHGGHMLTNKTLDLKTGKPIREEEIFIEDYQDDLSRLIVQVLTNENSLDDPIDLEDIGFFSVEEIYPNKNFYVSDAGITYTFNEYEIANYSMGAIEVTLPFERVRYLLKEDSPIAKIAF